MAGLDRASGSFFRRAVSKYPLDSLSQDQEVAILEYCDKAESLGKNKAVLEVTIAALQRLQIHDADIFMGLVERCRRSSVLWSVVRERSTMYINQQSPGSHLAIIHLRQTMGYPHPQDIETGEILGEPRTFELVAAMILLFDADELAPYRAQLHKLLRSPDTPAGMKGLREFRLAEIDGHDRM